MKINSDYDIDGYWNRLKSFHLKSPLNQSIIENRLPFGMKRELYPLRIREVEYNRAIAIRNTSASTTTTAATSSGSDVYNILKASDFLANLSKDPWVYNFNSLYPRASNTRRIEPKIMISNNCSSNIEQQQPKRLKFIQHRVIEKFKNERNGSDLESSGLSNNYNSRILYFDPTAILFFKENSELAMTNLTSNANGTVSLDKNHMGAVLTFGCWLLSLPDINKYSLIPHTQNNKLRGLKCAEFLAQEWMSLEGIGDEIEFVALTRNYEQINANLSTTSTTTTTTTTTINSIKPNLMKVLISRKSSRSRSGPLDNMEIFVFDCKGRIKFNSLNIEAKIINSSSLFNCEIEVFEGDVIILTKGIDMKIILTKISKIIYETLFFNDLEPKLRTEIEMNGGIQIHLGGALIVSKVHKFNEFNRSFSTIKDEDDFENEIDDKVQCLEINDADVLYGITDSNSTNGTNGNSINSTDSNSINIKHNHNHYMNIKYICHLDTKIGKIVNDPAPGSFGCTTRHSVIFRPNYFAALHHDASKINRFNDTINYLIRKIGDENNLGKKLEQEGDDGMIFRRLSDIQYFAYLLRVPFPSVKIHLGLGGGAKCVVIRKFKSKNNKNVKKFELEVYERPILRRLEYEIEMIDKTIYTISFLLLLSPHFSIDLIKSVNFNGNIRKFMEELMIKCEVDVFSIKVSMALFELQ